MATIDLKSIYNAWRGGESWQKLWKRQAPESKSVLPEMPELPEAPEPEAKVEPPVNVDALNAQNATLRAANVSLKAELADLKAALDSKTTLYENLKRSMGIMAAQTVANVPAVGEQKSLIDIYNAMPDGTPEKTAFYQKNKAELDQFVNKPKAS